MGRCRVMERSRGRSAEVLIDKPRWGRLQGWRTTTIRSVHVCPDRRFLIIMHSYSINLYSPYRMHGMLEGHGAFCAPRTNPLADGDKHKCPSNRLGA